jgi:hypothetical protein
MELQMKAICEGRTTRNDVVQQNLDQYRAVFNRTVQQINVLKSVSHDILQAFVCRKDRLTQARLSPSTWSKRITADL